MNGNVWGLALLGLLYAARPSLAEMPATWAENVSPDESPAEIWDSEFLPSMSSFRLQDHFVEANARTAGDSDPDDDNGETDEGPTHIRDNAFLVEEAFNQEPGVVQHIFNWIQFWDRTATESTRDFSAVYTMELPLGSQTHQFSFTVQALSAFEESNGSPPEQQGGVGDTFLNYRYQLLANDEFLWCAPRFTLIVPTGDERFDLGTGEVGYQFNLPISRYGDRFDFHFNAGCTITPDVNAQLPEPFPLLEYELRGYNLGGSAFWKPRVNLHFFLEALALWSDEIDELGSRTTVSEVFLNSGARYAVCQFDEVEWVFGIAVPVGLTADSPDIGVFGYMSVEHTFRKVAD